MNIEEYVSKLNKDLYRIIDEDTFIKILNLNNNMYRFNIINRVALAVMYEQELFDLKSKEEWFSLGRRIIKDTEKVQVALPVYSIEYIDNNTSEKIDINEFTSDELIKALELDIIQKREIADKLIISSMYDIRNTVNIDSNTKYDVPKPNLGITEYYDIIHKLTGITVEESESSFFYEKDKLLFLNRQNYTDTINILTDTLVKYMLHNIDNYVIDINNYKHINLSNKRIEKLLIACIKFSIQTIFGIKNKNEVIMTLRQSGVSSMEEMLDLLMIYDELITNIIKYIRYTNDSIYTDVIASVVMIKKSELLLNILQANSVNNKIEGS